MEHATALVTDDATTRFTCSCDKLVAAGWTVQCYACGRGLNRTPEAGELLVLVHHSGQHTCSACEACMDEMASDAEAVEDYDRLRDDELVDELVDDAERRVA